MNNVTSLRPAAQTLRPPARRNRGPKRTGKFIWGQRIASGGMGHVYAGMMEVSPDQFVPVAIKQMREDLAREARYVKMFLDEVRLGLSLKHTGYCRVLGFSSVGGAPWVALEWIEGATLLECLEGRGGERLAVDQVVELACQLTEALAVLHAAPGAPVHRDLSPNNVVLGSDGRAVILDLGVAVPSGTADVGKVVGKVRYVAPEQVAGLPVDARTDLFSLGVVLYELLTGGPLFCGPTPMDTLLAVRRAEVPDLRLVRRDVPRALAEWIHQLLSREPSNRYASATAARAALEGLRRSGDARLGALADRTRPAMAA